MEVPQKQYKAWLYLAPTLILMAIFTIYPLINTFIIAFKEDYSYLLYGTGRGLEYSSWGFGNFVGIFSAGHFIQYLKTTMVIVFVSVPVSVFIALIISVSLNGIKAFQRIYQTIFFMPYVTNTIAIGMVFAVMFDTNSGLINFVIKAFGGTPINWLGGNLLYQGIRYYPNYWTSMLVLLIYITWRALPFKILILLSGLQSIDKQYYQSAQIDGASKRRVLWRITVPLLSPQIAYLVITSFIGGFKEYTSVVAIFGEQAGPVGDQEHSMGTIVWYIYQRMIKSDMGIGMGYAAAGAVILFIIILFFTAINFYVSKKRVYY